MTIGILSQRNLMDVSFVRQCSLGWFNSFGLALNALALFHLVWDPEAAGCIIN